MWFARADHCFRVQEHCFLMNMIECQYDIFTSLSRTWIQIFMVNFYQVLQVNQSATLDEIRQAFKRRALQVHPDKGGTAAAFHLVYQALETLADPDERRKHDHTIQKGIPRKRFVARTKGSAESKEKSGKLPTSSVAKLMMKIQKLLKQLPRPRRLEAFQEEFSQQQRVLLEQWMKEFQQPEEPEVKCSKPDPAASGSSDTLALSTNFLPKKLTARHKVRKLGATAIKGISAQGDGSSGKYRAVVFFDDVFVYTKYCDLPTSLDYLVILTSTKQKMLDCSNAEGTFQERLEKALTSSSKEQGRSLNELNPSFMLTLSAGFFVGYNKIRSPTVKCLKTLQKMRYCMDPFRQFYKYWHGRRNMFWYFTPAELQDLWERLQSAQDEVCQLAGASSDIQLQRVRAWHAATEDTRQRHLRLWELGHMGSEDTSKHKAKHWSKGKLLARFPKRSGDRVNDCWIALKRQLVRWQGFLDRERQSKEKQRLKVRLQQRRIHQQQLKQKREALRKRMRDPTLTMDDILGKRSAKQECCTVCKSNSDLDNHNYC